MTPARAPVEVAVGVLIRPDRRFLLASRPAGKPYADYWEFPGGKIEAGESVGAALARELHEELGIDIGAALPWVVREFDYPHARVRLHFCRVFDWSGELQPREGQRFGFHSVGDLPAPLLPATRPVLDWLSLPPVYAVSDAVRLGADAFLRALEAGLADGLRLIQWREPELGADGAALFDQVLARTRASSAQLLVSSRQPRSWSARAQGLHLTAADLARTSERPTGGLLAASVHTREEIERAASVGADFVVAGPVLPTPTHPAAQPIGWSGFRTLAAGSAIPVYAIGGLTAADLPAALRAGAHGVALRRAAWPAG